jgi:prephenate dehydratase/chorismate mutase
MELSKIREEIDLKDSMILKLLNDRMELALIAKQFKTEIEDASREAEVLERIRGNARGLIDPEFSEKLYREIIAESKRVQKMDLELIGFAGEHGANSEIAAREWNSGLVAFPCPDFASVFEGVMAGRFRYGVVPVENTLGGVVEEANTLIIGSDVKVVGAVDARISHCLMVLPGTDHRDIRQVYSHPQALAQCRMFLQRNALEPVSFHNTASAAKMLAEKKPKATAVIASKLAAELYNLEIVKEGVEDLPENRTRFLILAKEPQKEAGNKCSILFSTAHKAGTLFRVLETFAKEEINLTRIESIPGAPGSYVFFLDFIGSLNDPKISSVLTRLPEMTGEFRLLGCYNEKVV